jgi:hypothetical protein
MNPTGPTATSSVQPPPDPSRIVFVDTTTGMLTQDGYWFLYLLFVGGQNAEGLAILEAFDSGPDLSMNPQIEELMHKSALFLEDAPGVTERRVQEVLKLLFSESSVDGVTQRQLDQRYILQAMGGDVQVDPRVAELEKLWALEWGSPQSTPAASGSTTIDTHTLTVASTNIVASVLPAPANSMLIVKLIADATGGRAVTWDAASFVYSPGPFTLLSNSRATVIFAADAASGKWEQAAPVQVHE